MTTETTETGVSDPSVGATTNALVGWHQINWRQAERNVRRLQTRIAQATQAGKWGKVKALQRLLTHSLSGKALAVRRVKENTGKRTAGVDGEAWKTPVLLSRSALTRSAGHLSSAEAAGGPSGDGEHGLADLFDALDRILQWEQVGRDQEVRVSRYRVPVDPMAIHRDSWFKSSQCNRHSF